MKNNFLKFAFLAIATLFITGAVYALTQEDRNAIEVELNRLTAELSNSGYEWLVNYSVDSQNINNQLGSSSIDVYEKNSNQKIAEFENIQENKVYKVLLNDWDGNQGTFDLQIEGGAVDFDYVVDPVEDLGKKDIISKRTIDSKHYLNPDGTYTAEIYSAPIFYKNDSGQWDDINTSLEPSTEPNYDYMNVKNNYKTYLSKDSLKGDYNVKYEKGDASIQLKTISKIKILEEIKTALELKTAQPDKIKTKLPDIISNKLMYPYTYNFTDKVMNIEYEILDNKLHEEFILNAPQDYPEIEQEIKLNNAYAKLEGNEILIFYKGTNEYLFTIPKPVMFEKNERIDPKTNRTSRFENYGLHYEFSDLNQTIFTIKKVLDNEGEDWLNSPDRVYPVVVDTDFAGSTNDGHVYGQDVTYATARNTALFLQMSNAMFNIGQKIPVFENDYGVYRSFLKFNTSSIDSGNVVTQVNLSLTVQADQSTTDFNVRIHKYNWSGTDPITMSNMETPYDGALASTYDADWRNTNGISLNTKYTSANLNTTWVNITGNTYYALLSEEDVINSAPPDSEMIIIHSQEATTSSYRPVLSVTYSLLDTCTYSSGNWDVNCPDNCTITSNVAMGGNNISIKGTGKFIVNGVNISNFSKLHIEGNSSSALCNVRLINGGRFKK